LPTFFMVEDDTPKCNGGAQRSDKVINTNKGKQRSFTIENKFKTRYLKNQKGKKNDSESIKRSSTDINRSNGNSKKDKFNNLKCIYFKARSIVNKQKELNLLVTEEDIDIVGITETWLNDKISDEELSIKGYTLYRKDRNDTIKTRGGGVAIYVRNELHPVYNSDLDESDFSESIWCSIKCNSEITVIGVCYRAPDSTETNDTALFSILSSFKNQRVVVLGDFNYPDIDWSQAESLDASHPFIECIGNNFLFQLVEEPTRGNNFLDLVLTSDDSIVQSLQVGEPFETSDHQIIRLKLVCEKSASEKVSKFMTI